MLIVSREPFADVIGRHANDRVLTGIISGVAMKQLDTDRPLLQPLHAAFERILSQITEQHLPPLAAAELRAGQDALEFTPDFVVQWQRNGLARPRSKRSRSVPCLPVAAWRTARERPVTAMLSHNRSIGYTR